MHPQSSGRPRGPRVQFTCERCGQSFGVVPNRAALGKVRYCSAACRWATTIQTTCATCGVTITRPPSGESVSGLYFCSRACMFVRQGEILIGKKRSDAARANMSAAARGNPKPGKQKPATTLTCPACQQPFSLAGRDTHRLKHRQLFCSHSCAMEGRHIPILRPTSIERAVGAALKASGVVFVAEYRIGRTPVDFYLPDLRLVIECQGNYWHCNPRLYPAGPIDHIQQRAVERDQRKHARLRAAGFRLVELWEADILYHGAATCLREALAPLLTHDS